MFKLEAIKGQTVQNMLVALVFALVVWVAHFYDYRQFSLYYEDYARIPTAMQWNWSQLWDFWVNIPESIIKAEYEGRPFHPGLILLFAYLGDQLGGLSAIYILAYAINLLGVSLFYSLMRRSFNQPFFALTSSLGFALFPVNTNAAFLTSAFGLIPSLILILIASHLFLASRRNTIICSYFLVFTSLYCYEKFLPLFWAAPLLKPDWKWNAQSKQELFRHTLILAFMLFVAALIRKLNGEGRVTKMDGDSLLGIVISVTMGPIVTITAFINHAIQSLTILKLEWFIPLCLLMVAIAYCLHRSKLFVSEKSFLTPKPFRSRDAQTFLKSLAQLSILGYVILTLGYVLTLTGNTSKAVFNVTGRPSLVHVAAIVGASMLCGCFCCAIRFFADRHQKRVISTIGLSLFFTLLIAFGLGVQQDLVAVGAFQRGFFTEVSRLCPDMTRNTIILVEFDSSSEEIFSFGGRFSRILGYIYQFPDQWTNEQKFNWATQPKIYRMSVGWQDRATLSNNNLINITSQEVVGNRGITAQFASSETIFLKAENNGFVRQTQLLMRNGRILPLKQNNSSLDMPPFKSNVLFDDLIISNDEATATHNFTLGLAK
jgi:hypothetical protein